MKQLNNQPLVQTIKEKCRMCYTCVRECPAKAIRIENGQAHVIPERCIGCGNCVRVCSQSAKQVLDSTEAAKALLSSGKTVSACLAPSFPAAFPETDYNKVIAAIRALGFDYVHEVGFGADLVASEYRKLFRESDGQQRYIGTSCPALVKYVKRYYPELVDTLAPIASPMQATALALRELYSQELGIVFIGPCIAKKDEDSSETEAGEVDAVLTFKELKRLFEEYEIDVEQAGSSDTDPPHPNIGAIFPISRGMLQAADLDEDLITGEVISADGRSDFVGAVKEFANGDMDARLLEVLCCNGCIMGSGIDTNQPLFKRRTAVSQYVKKRVASLDLEQWEKDMQLLERINMRRAYTPEDQRFPLPSREELEKILRDMGKTKPEDELNCGACGYETCQEHATAIYQGLAETEMCLPSTIEQLNQAIDDLAISNDRLAKTQEALLQSEKLASMGQLAAGIAHELNNPLGVVLMYANLLKEEQKENSEDLDMIADQAERCKNIVSGLLHFARQNKVVRKPVNLRGIAEKGLRSIPIPDNVTVHVEEDIQRERGEVDEDQLTQVLTNLISNGCDAMEEGGTLILATRATDNTLTLEVTDTGPGIPEEVRKKMYEPFFTTKEFGKGTGLGLAVSHGIIKMHSGDISVTTNTEPEKGPTGTTFTITIPLTEEE